MELLLRTKQQHQIADLLWAAESVEEADAIVQKFGRDAIVVRDLMLAATMDEVTDTDLAVNVLNQIRSK